MLDRLDAIMQDLAEVASDETAPELVRRIARCGVDALLAGLDGECERLSLRTAQAERSLRLH
ncbi:hypothetical protein [Salinarimonas soli]|uniref:Uncharacterized protein n=1 Tax=Salinarimonas soli TaxID=1638099 RepID=A0A5B2VH55_9HYPH|nr:hypothetical protein [Salinarimonas soli]KAA2238275.1 hypothetical protein F0L46_06415 [Salinarimonas soli]